jgi:hypothetical protein
VTQVITSQEVQVRLNGTHIEKKKNMKKLRTVVEAG